MSSLLLPEKSHQSTGRKSFDQACRCSSFACYQVSHPNNDLLQAGPPDRLLRRSICDLTPDIQHLISDAQLDSAAYKLGLKNLHSEAVNQARAKFLPNRVLGREPPDVCKSEMDLPRSTRSTLSQLRSGWSIKLNAYLHRIDDRIPDTCPLCGMAHHDTKHLFECPANPTSLTTESLWTKPQEAAAFLGLPTRL